MPKTKNQGKNKSRFEIRGGVLNEYEFALNEGAMAEEERNRLAQMEEGRELREGEEGSSLATSPQEREATRIREVMETSHEKAQRNIEKREQREGKSPQKSSSKVEPKRASKAGAGKKGAGKKAPAAKRVAQRTSRKRG